MLTNEQVAGMSIFVAVFLIAGICYVQTLRNAFMLNNKQFVQVGVMEYQADGDKVYIPVFKKRN